jgi:hypothetical protein
MIEKSKLYELIADKYTATELVDILEELGLLEVWDIIYAFESELEQVNTEDLLSSDFTDEEEE